MMSELKHVTSGAQFRDTFGISIPELIHKAMASIGQDIAEMRQK